MDGDDQVSLNILLRIFKASYSRHASCTNVVGNLSMKLTDKHIDFGDTCRQMFIGQVIRKVIYGEVKYFSDEEGKKINPEPYYKTKYSDIDTLDHSVYFKTDSQTIYVHWDNTFASYGLSSRQIELTESTNDYEQKWDVSNETKWTQILGHRITDFKINWKEIWTSNLDGSNKVASTYPQAFLFTLDNEKKVVISAAEFKRDNEDEIYELMDNLLVTTNMELARQLKLIS